MARRQGLKEDKVVAANDLSPQKARILLMFALLNTADPEAIQQFFDEH